MKYFLALLIVITVIEVSAQNTGYRAGIGIPIVKNVMVGLQDNFRYKRQANDKLSTYSNTVGPFVRYNFPVGRFAVFPQVTAGMGLKSNINYVVDWSTGQAIAKRSTKRTTELLAGVGATYLIARNIGIETLLDFDIKKKRPGLDLGLQFYLKRKVR